jgi:hypothetical protein
MTAETKQAERHARKRLERAGWQQEPLIRVIEMRRRQGHHYQHGSSAPVDWSTRWFVSGHWRQQACGPKHTERRPCWVGPFIKGPADRPLKPPPRNIFAVIR